MKLAVAMIVVCLFCAAAQACPYCADTIHNTDATSASSLGGAMNLSIYCMFMGLFVAFGIVLRAVMKGIRNQ
jgi:hypothetical protein